MRFLKLILILSFLTPVPAAADCGELCSIGFWRTAKPEQLQQLLASGADINGQKASRSVLHFAALGHPKLLRLLLEAGAPPNVYDKRGRSPLHYAEISYTQENYELLLLHGADPNARDKDGRTPLHILSFSQRYSDEPETLLAIAELLLAHGADPNIARVDGTLPIHGAVSNRHSDLMHMLIAAGTDLHAAPDLLLPAAQSKSTEIVTELLKQGVPIDARDADGATVLHRAAIMNAPEIIPLLTDAGADPNIRDNNGDTPLLIAANRPLDESIRFLLAAGADVSIANNQGELAIHRAAAESWTGVVQILIEAGTDVHARTSDGYTPLHTTADDPFAYASTAQLMIDAGADIEARSPDGHSALHFAASWKNIDLIDALITAGADINARDDQGRTPLAVLGSKGGSGNINSLLGWESDGRITSLLLLLDAGSDVNAASNNGATSLHYIALQGTLEDVKLLIEAGADPCVRTVAGYTAAQLAVCKTAITCQEAKDLQRVLHCENPQKP